MGRNTKIHGQVFTPPHLVGVILDYCGYTSGNILRRHVIDNSCGNGAFLCEIVRRYMSDFLRESSDIETLRQELSQYVHGIELVEEVWQECITMLNNVVDGVAWDVRCADALSVSEYIGRMDYVVGNPPYVRVHNLDNYELVKTYSFASTGMIDLYIVFFELGFRMLNKKGRMCIITPSSWLGSKAGALLRRYILDHRNLSGLIDLGHYQPFAATTYTVISRFEGCMCPVYMVDCQTYDGQLHHTGTLRLADMYIDGTFFIAGEETLRRLREVRETPAFKWVTVKNGFATLADTVFVSDNLPQEDCQIDIVKASTGKWSRCVYPYDMSGRPLTIEYMKDHYPQTYDYLVANKEKLCKRDADSNQWHLFGRTQAIKDVQKNKIAVNTLLRDKGDVKMVCADKGKGVYSGLYVLTRLSFEKIHEIVCSDEFASYVAVLKNYKSGGYYTFSSRDLELYINYKLRNSTYEKIKVS